MRDFSAIEEAEGGRIFVRIPARFWDAFRQFLAAHPGGIPDETHWKEMALARSCEIPDHLQERTRRLIEREWPEMARLEWAKLRGPTRLSSSIEELPGGALRVGVPGGFWEEFRKFIAAHAEQIPEESRWMVSDSRGGRSCDLTPEERLRAKRLIEVEWHEVAKAAFKRMTEQMRPSWEAQSAEVLRLLKKAQSEMERDEA